jgi:hypothetical protein
MPFRNTSLDVRTSDGRNVKLLEDLVYLTDSGETITVPAGSESDGYSTPRELWIQFPPFGPSGQGQAQIGWFSAILHDWAYRYSSLSKHECDMLLLEAMRSQGVSALDRDLIYEGVNLGGQSAFDTDRKNQQQKEDHV